MPEEHVHKYVRVRLGKKGYIVYKCVSPGCKHYIRKELIVGYKYICWRCNNVAVMTQKTAQMKKPHCGWCYRRRKEVA